MFQMFLNFDKTSFQVCFIMQSLTYSFQIKPIHLLLYDFPETYAKFALTLHCIPLSCRLSMHNSTILGDFLSSDSM